MTGKTSKLEEAKHVSCLEILQESGHDPVDKTGGEYFFYAPWRAEKLPSLIVYPNNKWSDFGEDKRAKDVIDLYSRLHGTSFHESIDRLIGVPREKVKSLEVDRKPKSKINSIQELSDPSLFGYLKKRKIEPSLAKIYCKEVHIEFFKKPGEVKRLIGFKNDLGGYELRSNWSKSSTSPKTITHLEGAGESVVFEGFFEFLSYLTWIRKETVSAGVIVLNGVGMWEIALKVMQNYHNNLFLNNDKAGKEKTATFLEKSNSTDHSFRYEGYNDINDFIRNIKI